jgi:hypothetical protein
MRCADGHTTRVPACELGFARAALACIVLTFASGADAHVGPVRGTSPFVVNDTFRGGATTWGIVLAEGDRFLRVCEEAFAESPAFHTLFDDGRILIGGQTGLFVTRDGGCTYTPLSVVWSGLPFVSMARARATEHVVFVATTTTLYRSDDAGLTFEPAGELAGAPILREIVVSDDGAIVAATGFSSATGQPVVIRSDDGGQTFHAAVRAELSRLIALTIDDDGGVLVSEIPPIGGSTLASTNAQLETTSIALFGGAVTDAVVFAGVRHVIVDRMSTWSETAPGQFTAVFGGPSGCFARPPSATALWGCARFADLTHFLSTTDGVTFSGHMPYGLVEERICPTGTPGQARCDFIDSGVIPDGGVDDAGDDGGALDAGPVEPVLPWCACDVGTAGSDALSVMWIAACGLMLRRRRRRSACDSAFLLRF